MDSALPGGDGAGQRDANGDAGVSATDAPTAGSDAAGSGNDAVASSDAASGPPISCMYAEKDNPNKAELSYVVSEVSGDSNLASKGYSGEARVLVAHSAAAKIITFGFNSPFGGSPAPCLRAAITIGGAEAPAPGSSYSVAPNALLNPVTVVENSDCLAAVNLWNSWSLAGASRVIFSSVNGPNAEISFSLKMGPKHGASATGTFTLSGTIKTPCYFAM
jgi:hypothetical protein